MQNMNQDLYFSTVVSESFDVNEFIVEFSLNDETAESLIKVTNNFDELIDFFSKLEE